MVHASVNFRTNRGQGKTHVINLEFQSSEDPHFTTTPLNELITWAQKQIPDPLHRKAQIVGFHINGALVKEELRAGSLKTLGVEYPKNHEPTNILVILDTPPSSGGGRRRRLKSRRTRRKASKRKGSKRRRRGRRTRRTRRR